MPVLSGTTYHTLNILCDEYIVGPKRDNSQIDTFFDDVSDIQNWEWWSGSERLNHFLTKMIVYPDIEWVPGKNPEEFKAKAQEALANNEVYLHRESYERNLEFIFDCIRYVPSMFLHRYDQMTVNFCILTSQLGLESRGYLSSKFQKAMRKVCVDAEYKTHRIRLLEKIKRRPEADWILCVNRAIEIIQNCEDTEGYLSIHEWYEYLKTEYPDVSFDSIVGFIL